MQLCANAYNIFSGDMYPATALGKVFALVTMVFGIMFLAMSLSVVGSNFSDVWDKRLELLLRIYVQKHLDHAASEKEGWLQLCDTIDQSNEGEINLLDFKLLLGKLGVRVSDRQAKELFLQMDDDDSGAISFHEFFSALLPEIEIPDHVLDIYIKQTKVNVDQLYLASLQSPSNAPQDQPASSTPGSKSSYFGPAMTIPTTSVAANSTDMKSATSGSSGTTNQATGHGTVTVNAQQFNELVQSVVVMSQEIAQLRKAMKTKTSRSNISLRPQSSRRRHRS